MVGEEVEEERKWRRRGIGGEEEEDERKRMGGEEEVEEMKRKGKSVYNRQDGL